MRPLLACAITLALTGCLGSSRPSRFYTLEPLQVRNTPDTAATDATVAVGPVELPDYVDRPQIVTRSGSNELVISEFERWGGSLDRQVSGSLVATLRDRLATRQIAVVPWRSPVPPSGAPYRVTVTVTRFDGVPGQSVILRARWELSAPSGGKEESLAVREASLTEQIDGPGYDALVAAMERALVRLGEEMADGIVSVRQVARAP